MVHGLEIIKKLNNDAAIDQLIDKYISTLRSPISDISIQPLEAIALARQVVFFLKLTSYLKYEGELESITINVDKIPRERHMGTANFEILIGYLSQHFPNWREWPEARGVPPRT